MCECPLKITLRAAGWICNGPGVGHVSRVVCRVRHGRNEVEEPRSGLTGCRPLGFRHRWPVRAAHRGRRSRACAHAGRNEASHGCRNRVKLRIWIVKLFPMFQSDFESCAKQADVDLEPRNGIFVKQAGRLSETLCVSSFTKTRETVPWFVSDPRDKPTPADVVLGPGVVPKGSSWREGAVGWLTGITRIALTLGPY